MRIWDIPVERLCRNHLLGEHRELHAIWSIIIHDKHGYSRHPEVMRWCGRLVALWERHEEQRMEMEKRGYAHNSSLSLKAIPLCHRGREPVILIDSLEDQRKMIGDKGCSCDISEARKPFAPFPSRRSSQAEPHLYVESYNSKCAHSTQLT